MKKVYASQDRLMAGHMKNLLAEEGMVCLLKNEHVTSAMGEIPPNECWIEVWIAEDELYDRATEIVKEALSCRDSPSGQKWRCTHCGEEHETQFSSCWNCGKERVGEK